MGEFAFISAKQKLVCVYFSQKVDSPSVLFVYVKPQG